MGTGALSVGEGSKIGRGIMLNYYVHLVPMLSAAITLHPFIPSWHGKVKFTLEHKTKAQIGTEM
jgi:hypothetical protein